MARCATPIAEQTLVDYWTRDLADSDAIDDIEEHLFACGECSTRLQRIAELGTGIARLVREGRLSGIVSRSVLNRLQRDGFRVRMFSLLPGETVPCAVFPGDDLVVTSLRADFAGVDAMTLSVTGPGHSPFAQIDDVPVPGPGDELLWATPASVVQQLPSIRLELTLASADAARTELARYVLEHSATQG